MITEKELLNELKISRTTLWRLKRNGMPYIKVGSSYRYDKDSILNWLKNNSQNNTTNQKNMIGLDNIMNENKDTEEYKKIEVPVDNLSDEDINVINLISKTIKKEDMYIEISSNSHLTIFLKQIDLNKIKSIDTNNTVIRKIVEPIEAIKSYGIKGGKRIYVDYDKERKVVNRKLKEENRGKYFYASEDAYSKNNNPLPDKFVNRIICGDSQEILKTLPDNCIDLIFTSPPYNFGLEYKNHKDEHFWNDYFEKLFKILSECIRVLKYGGRIAINIQPLFSDYIPTHHIISNFFLKKQMIWKGEIIWEKNNYNCKYTAWGSWKSPSNPYLKYTWEFIEIYCKGTLKKEGEKTNIDITAEEFKDWVVAKWSIAPERDMQKYGHPAMFPPELAKRVIKLLSYQNDIVLDPFNGVGTTTTVANKLNRQFIGIDISKEYCDKAIERLTK